MKWTWMQRLCVAGVAVLVWSSCNGPKRPDEATRRALYKQLQAAEKEAEVMAFEFIQTAENPHDIENVERYRQIRKDSATAAWGRIMAAAELESTWADSIWTEGLAQGWGN